MPLRSDLVFQEEPWDAGQLALSRLFFTLARTITPPAPDPDLTQRLTENIRRVREAGVEPSEAMVHSWLNLSRLIACSRGALQLEAEHLSAAVNLFLP